MKERPPARDVLEGTDKLVEEGLQHLKPFVRPFQHIAKGDTPICEMSPYEASSRLA